MATEEQLKKTYSPVRTVSDYNELQHRMDQAQHKIEELKVALEKLHGRKIQSCI